MQCNATASPGPQSRWRVALLGFVALIGLMGLAGCERPNGMTSTQTGYRGVAMGQVSNPRVVGPVVAAQPLPDPVPAIPSPEGSPLAKDTFKNVQVLGDLPVGEFTRTMLSITAWVSPKQGCAYCHAPGEDMSSDKLYTKLVARKMLQMTRHVNTDWQQHVAANGASGAGGVTCYTCHRGEPVPAKVWFTNLGPKQAGGASAESDGQNHPSPQAGLTALGLDVLTPYLLKTTPIRVEGTSALPVDYRPTDIGNGSAGLRQTEGTFGLMMHMSQSLGVNCTHCHNTRAIADWAQSPPARTTAYHGIQMARELNNAYMVPLTSTFPAERLGPTGDVAKISCATCHQGLSRPLNGAQLLKDHPALAGVKAPAAAMPAAAPAEPAAPAATGLLGRILFEVGKSQLGAEAVKTIADASAALKAKPELKVALSGFADKTGNADQNLELAKQRAFAVRDALKAEGVGEDRVQLKKPEFAIGGAEADARRVEINVAP